MPEVTSKEFEMSDPGTLSINQLKVSLIVVEAGIGRRPSLGAIGPYRRCVCG
jgi:hypothetical protein